MAKKNGFTLETLPKGFNVINLKWCDRHPKLYMLSTYLVALLVLATISFLIWLLVKERKKRAETQRSLERENTLYNMAVANSKTFAWERQGEVISFGDAFWTHYDIKPRKLYVDDFMHMVHINSRQAYANGVEAVNRGEAASAK